MSVNEYVLEELARARLAEARATAARHTLARARPDGEPARARLAGVLARLVTLLRPAPAAPRVPAPHSARR